MDAAVCAFDPDRHGISDGLSDRAVSVQKEEDVKRQRLIFFLFLLVGMGFLNYPFVSQWVNQRNQSKVIYEYEKKAEKLSDTGKQKLLGEARNYNSKLAQAEYFRVTVLEVAQKKLLHTENIRNFWMSPETGSCVIWKFRRSRSFCRFFMELRSMFWNRGRDICLVLHFLSGEGGHML